MGLEVLMIYLVALAVPVWLLVEQIVSWRVQARERQEQVNQRDVSSAPSPGTTAGARRPTPLAPALRRKAA